MMKKYVFEIQNCVKAFAWGDTKEEARQNLLNDIDNYSSEMLDNCYVSDGEEYKGDDWMKQKNNVRKYPAKLIYNNG